MSGLVLMQAVAFVYGEVSLRETLEKSKIGLEGLENRQLDTLITSFEQYDDAEVYLLAYYLDDSSNCLPADLQLLMLDKAKHEWKQATIDRTQFEIAGGSMTKVDRSKNGFYLYGHINPSAGATIAVSPALEVRGSFYGWYLADFADGSVVYRHSQPHFAPVHPAQISLLNFSEHTNVLVHPKQQCHPVRSQYILDLASVYDSLGRQWFAVNNHPMDPSLFDEYVKEVAINDDADSLAVLSSICTKEVVDCEEDPNAWDRLRDKKRVEVITFYQNVRNLKRIRCWDVLAEKHKKENGEVDLDEALRNELNATH